MKLRNRLTLAALLLVGFSGSVLAQNSASANGYAQGNILKPISVQNFHDLAFGSLIPSATAGTAVIGVTGLNVSSTALITETPVTTNCVAYNAQNALNSWASPGPAVFQAKGALGFNFAITLPTNAVPVQLQNNDFNAPNMTADNFTCVVGAPGVVGTSGTLSVGIGVQYFAVGATLHVPASARAGAYTGQFSVTVNYN